MIKHLVVFLLLGIALAAPTTSNLRIVNLDANTVMLFCKDHSPLALIAGTGVMVKIGCYPGPEQKKESK